MLGETSIRAPSPAQGFLKLQAARSGTGCKKVSRFSPFLHNFPRQPPEPALGTRTASVGLGGCSLQLLSVLSEERGNQGFQKVNGRHIFILTHIISWPYIKEETTQKHLSD